MPLLGILFLPFTTVMYLLAWTLTGGIEGWDWMWIILGVIMDVGKWGQVLANRKQAAAQLQHYYPSGAPITAPVAAAPVAAEPVATEPAEPVSPTGDGAPDLARSNELRASGVLTDEEYDAAKAKLDG